MIYDYTLYTINLKKILNMYYLRLYVICDYIYYIRLGRTKFKICMIYHYTQYAIIHSIYDFSVQNIK